MASDALHEKFPWLPDTEKPGFGRWEEGVWFHQVRPGENLGAMLDQVINGPFAGNPDAMEEPETDGLDPLA